MTLAEFEALAREKLTKAERELLARRLLAEDATESHALSELDARLAKIGTVISGRRNGQGSGEDYSVWGLGSAPVDCGVTDGSENHDKYFYDSPDD